MKEEEESCLFSVNIEKKSDLKGNKIISNKEIDTIKCFGLNFKLIKSPKITAPNKLTHAALV